MDVMNSARPEKSADRSFSLRHVHPDIGTVHPPVGIHYGCIKLLRYYCYSTTVLKPQALATARFVKVRSGEYSREDTVAEVQA